MFKLELRILIEESIKMSFVHLVIHFIFFCFMKINVEWFKKHNHAMNLCFPAWEMSNMISDYSSISVFSFRKRMHALYQWQRRWTSEPVLRKLPRIPANESMDRDTVFFIYFCKLLCLTHSWEEKSHCFLYLKLFKRWAETPISLGCVVTWAYLPMWCSVGSN